MNVANNNKPMNIMDMHVENYAPLSNGGPSNQEKQYYPYSHIGCDETGSGDFFGPLCVVACYIDERDYDWLASLNVRDPKLMTPQEVIEIDREIKDRLVYSLLILDNSHYNQMAAAGNNLANIKAKLYNQAMINVIQRIEHPISKVTIDAFLAPKKYYRYLKSKIVVVRHIEFKKEEMSLAMKCAHILSQYAYLQYYQNMCQSLNTTLPRGFNILANDAGTSLVQEYGKDILYKVSKTNFPNYKQILERVK